MDQVQTGIQVLESTALSLSLVDKVWLGMSIALIGLMQLGFLMVESGATRPGAAVNIAAKNLLDLAIALTAFWCVGSILMFGPSFAGTFGFGVFLPEVPQPDSDALLALIFQTMFCATAITIISGAVAERCHLGMYLAISTVMALLIYPVFGHMTWGNVFLGDNLPLLAEWGFMDFAGSTVVHATGAWVALAVVLALGPRHDRFDEAGVPRHMELSNPVLSAAGGVCMLIGWVGFNGGSLMAVDETLGDVLSNTFLAAGAGLIAGVAYSFVRDGARLPVSRIVNGMLGGLVAVTAGCNLFDSSASIAVGMLGGLVAHVSNDILLHKFRVDDVVGAIGVHGFAGVAGTLVLPLLVPASALATGSLGSQLAVQATGVLLNLAWAFTLAFAAVWLLRQFLPARISIEDERIGIDRVRHGVRPAPSALSRVLDEMINAETTDPDDVRSVPHASNEIDQLKALMLSVRTEALNDARARVQALRRQN
ncbi:MAG: hypothetical protein AAF409_02305 [Pseudomonadota bacterium]